MKDQIKQIQILLLEEIKKGNIQIVKSETNKIKFTVFDEYPFEIFIHEFTQSANISTLFCEDTFMILPNLDHEEQKELFKTVYPLQQKHLKEVSLKQKQAELEKLTSEINSINNLNS